MYVNVCMYQGAKRLHIFPYKTELFNTTNITSIVYLF